MFYNHLKVAVRYLLHHKTYALTNIAGLTLGLGCFLLLNSYIGSEKNFDGMNPGAYRLLQKITDSNGLVRKRCFRFAGRRRSQRSISGN